MSTIQALVPWKTNPPYTKRMHVKSAEAQSPPIGEIFVLALVAAVTSSVIPFYNHYALLDDYGVGLENYGYPGFGYGTYGYPSLGHGSYGYEDLGYGIY
ncbi:hypothetical protein TNCV_4579831 [Trichonephila clavipes]|nr:hypothetical protein TNCV_4579831 [Trichonephila clavipes]